MGDPYAAPRSPDLSLSLSLAALPSYSSYPSQSSAPAKSYPHSSSYAIPQHQLHPSYHQPPQYLHHQHQQQQQQQQQLHQPHPHHASYPSGYDLPPTLQQQSQPQTRQQRTSRTAKIEPDDLPWLPPSEIPSVHPRATKHQSSKSGSISAMPRKERTVAPGEAEGIVVKTKFPVARIKRIVQADEDVGKVAQVTPVVVSKALELFMISLTLKSAAVARSKSSKRITAAHLKQAVLAEPQFDFLQEIVNKVADAPAGKEQAGAKEKREEEMEWKGEGSGDEWGGGGGGGGEGAVKGKRKRAPAGEGRRRRGKVASDDD